jgi:hypothetical protein
MFSKVRITNFKSLRDLEFEPKRVNVFIGEPNVGKSNVLEALATLSQGTYNSAEAFQDVLRFKSASDLFFDKDLGHEAKVEADDWWWLLKYDSGRFMGHCGLGKSGARTDFVADRAGKFELGQRRLTNSSVQFYRFKPLSSFSDASYGVLRAPYGDNLVALLSTNSRLRRLVGDLFRSRDYRLVLDAEKGELAIAKEVNDQLYQFSYPTISETLRRIVFYMAVLETNQNSILLLDEPEANTFPFYTTYLAERIALDETNQFFLTTHNPYVLGSLVAKTLVKDLAVFVTTMDGYRTVLKLVPEQGLSRILDYNADAFLNLDRLTES